MHQRREILSSQIGNYWIHHCLCKIVLKQIIYPLCFDTCGFAEEPTTLSVITSYLKIYWEPCICQLNHHLSADYLENQCVIHWTEIYIQWAALSTLWTAGARCEQFYCNLFGTGNLCHKGSTRNVHSMFFLFCLSFKSWYKMWIIYPFHKRHQLPFLCNRYMINWFSYKHLTLKWPLRQEQVRLGGQSKVMSPYFNSNMATWLSLAKNLPSAVVIIMIEWLAQLILLANHMNYR